MLGKLPPGKMYNFYIDDNVFFFTDIWKNKYKSIFDCFYLAGLKKIHEEFGTLFTLNTFNHNYHQPEFDITLFPDTYKEEFTANASWLRFAFHGEIEYPGYPYFEAYPEKIGEHYEKWEREMVRIMGREPLIAPVIFHYYKATMECKKFMRAKGQKFLTVGESPYMLYLPEEDMYQLQPDVILNLFKDDIQGIRDTLEGKIASGQEKILIGSHEQYSFPFYANYIPRYFDEIRAACETMKKHGYTCVYFNEIL